MSVSQHPVALRLERRVGDGTKLLATVMGLPLVDGIFPALVLAGAVDGVLGIFEVGLLVFGGSATFAVVLADMDGSRREQVTSILTVGVPLLAVAAVEAALAPTIGSLLNMVVFERFAALVILAIAAKTASATVGEYLPSPGVIVGLGLLASLDPTSLSVQFIANPALVVRGVAAAGVGVGFALTVALLGPWLRGNVDLDRFRFGSAVALGVLPLSILGVIDASVPLALAVLAVTALLSLDPDGRGEPLPASETAGPVASPDGGERSDGARASSDEQSESDGGAQSASTSSAEDAPSAATSDRDDYDGDDHGSSGVSDGDRAPWL